MSQDRDPKGYYAALGVDFDANASDIKAAFRRKAMELHPDRNRSTDATGKFQKINQAYGTLSDPDARAAYDALSFEPPLAETTDVNDIEPIACSCCGKVTAQPRYMIFYKVMSFVVLTRQTPVQGIFCSACAEMQALKASAVTWILGWWGFPWGPIWSIRALLSNMNGGKRPAGTNVSILCYQAGYFASVGRNDLARGIAQEAERLLSKGAGTEGDRRFLDNLSRAIGGFEGPGLKKVWSHFNRSFFAQAAALVAIFGGGGLWIAHEEGAFKPPPPSWETIAANPVPYEPAGIAPRMPTSSPSKGSKPYVSTPPPMALHTAPAAAVKPLYVRPATAPNGSPWPVTAGYIEGYAKVNTNGLSKVTVDNSRNDSDVFVKLVSLNGPTAWPSRVFYIPARSSFTVESVTAGSYDIRYRDLRTGGLSRSQQFELEERSTYNGTEFSEMTLTLYKVRNGNMQTYELSEDKF